MFVNELALRVSHRSPRRRTSAHSRATATFRRGILGILLLGGFVVGVSSPGLAQDVNKNGVLVLHTDNNYEYTRGVDPANASGVECGQNLACPYDPDCADNVAALEPTSSRGSDVTVWWILALFPEKSCPQVKGLTFGVEWDVEDDIRLVGWGHSGDFELPDTDWPAYSGSGNAVTYREPQRSRLIEVYWFAGYAENGPAEFRLTPHPVHDGAFADHLCPPTVNRVMDYGSLGLNGAQGRLGLTPEPEADAFFRVTPTGIRSSVVVSHVEAGLLSPGDEIGIFAAGRLVGATVWNGSAPLEIPVWKWNQQHDYPGAREGDLITVQTWCPSTLVASPVRVQSQRGIDPVFSDRDYVTSLVLGEPPLPAQNPLPTPPSEFALMKVFPNPATGPLQFRFQLPRGTDVQAQIFDAAGRMVQHLQKNLSSGERSIYWDGRDARGVLVPSGIYYARLLANGEVQTRQFQMVR